jgi:very-short-patch-repair endonuclease
MISEELSARVELDAALDPRINFAMQQNSVPVVKRLELRNVGNEPLRDVRVRVTAEPGFAEPWEGLVARIPPEASYVLDDVDLRLSPGHLVNLTERESGILRFSVLEGEERLAEASYPVELLAYDEWSGLQSLPEILAAFVLPNHPAVETILRDAAGILHGWTPDGGLSGYQTRDRAHVIRMAAAVYAALQKLDLAYINPPASFEHSGQKIRLPDRIVDSRLATCLDLAVLTAGCLEQCGLHPLLVLLKGHAFAGVWPDEDTFPEPRSDEPLRLRKRVDLGEILVFELTTLTARPSVTFDAAIDQGRRHLEDVERFACVVDVGRARKSGILPVPPRRQDGTFHPVESSDAQSGDVRAPTIPAIRPSIDGEESDDTETPASRLDRWKRKLLDLSLNNRLLNFRPTKKTIPLLCPNLSALEDALASGSVLKILSRPADFGPGDPRSGRRGAAARGLDKLLREELDARRVYADLDEAELGRRLLETFRLARTSTEEGGASTLYLALGFLCWYETPQSSEQRLAPIVLLPVKLERKSAQQGFTLRLGEDDARINVTLLEMLTRDFGLRVSNLDPLPEDQSGIDLAEVFRVVRNAVKDVDRWDVIEEGQLGLFSFKKFLMWRDLQECSELLLQNEVVKHLVDRSREAFDAGGRFPDRDRLDEQRSPASTFCPLVADSSQLAGVFAAADGRSFVLEGPPGTGKSQTITNIIAQCLASGKTVLFVSEKMAALNVVHRRLNRVGLGRFCLELHSNKASKVDVVRQLGDALDHAGAAAPPAWDQKARRLASTRKELNAYVDALHCRRSTGESVFQATSRLIGLRDTPRVRLSWASPDSIDADQLADLRDLVERLMTAAEAVRVAHTHPLADARHEEWSQAWTNQVTDALTALEAATRGLTERARPWAERLALRSEGWSADDLQLCDAVAGMLGDSPTPPVALLVRSDWQEIQTLLGTWIETGHQRDALRAEVFQRYTPRVIDLDLDDLAARLRQAEASWPVVSWFRIVGVRRALKRTTTDGKAPKRETLAEDLARAKSLQMHERALMQAADEAREILGSLWKDGEAEWTRLEALAKWAALFRTLALRAAAGDPGNAATYRERWATLATDSADLLRSEGPLRRELTGYTEALRRFWEAHGRLAGLLALADSPDPSTSDLLGRTTRRLESWRAGLPHLRDWCAWRKIRGEALKQGLEPLVAAFEGGEIRSEQLRDVFERSFAQWWVEAVTDSEGVLKDFFSPGHQQKITVFRNLDEELTQLTSQALQARLGAQVPPDAPDALPSSEMGILSHERQRRRGHKAVRRLIQEIPNLLPRLKPCVLMSPLSVAQYLPPGAQAFDVVIFDEASQIPIWDAIGALARGKQAIVVGDPKQLPPTSFFMRSDDEDDEDAIVITDMESILDDCIAARLPKLRLAWHYRSLHESLIAFSNRHYYDDCPLLTFPSPHLEGMGVAFRHVSDGIYDKGKSRTNRGEAEAVVAEIVERLKDSDRSAHSIGVVTFNQSQQTLIEDLLDQARRESPEIEPFFGDEAEEPVFVKNLENVQGDERDVILFSICFGPDPQGRIAMNFGPMNRSGGERRLNVAITRARREVLVFSTLRADQIDLARTNARGARDLKEFLDYAENGPSALAAATHFDPDADFDSPFEQEVRDRVAANGWQVHLQVGCSGYRIDLAVVDPDAPGRYLLGIECDGANYHRAKTARDRDRLREAVLRDLGWEIHRVWSTDWWTNPEREIEKIEQALRKASDGGPNRNEGNGRQGTDSGARSRLAHPAAMQTAASVTSRTSARQHPQYRAFPVARQRGGPDDFYSQSHDQKIRRAIVEVVNHEAPVSLSLATRRVCNLWGFERVSPRAQERISQLVPSAEVRMTNGRGGVFLWRPDQEPQSYQGFRVSGEAGDTIRAPEELPLEEIANAAAEILQRQISVPAEDLARETGRLFGFARFGTKVAVRMRDGVALLVQTSRATSSGESIHLPRA